MCANFTRALESVVDLAQATFLQVFPTHDTTGQGAPKEDVAALAKSLQQAGAEQLWRLLPGMY